MVAYLYPGYKSYKTLSQRPANEDDIQRWLMYWSVIGCVVAIESAEWLVNWSVHHPSPSSLALIPPIDRLNCPFRIPPVLQDTAILPLQNRLHPLPRPTSNPRLIVSLYPPSPTILPRIRTPDRRHSFFAQSTFVCIRPRKVA